MRERHPAIRAAPVWRVKAESHRVELLAFLQVTEAEAQARNFLRSVLRSSKILMQNSAILRNAVRKQNYELPGVSNDMQSSETLRNSLGLNYESPALTAELQARVDYTVKHSTPQRTNPDSIRGCSNR